ncbi:hypothetical protein QLQ12_41260 [Actinoplanes sp. NEAU-A12]|uniref:Uncharacterized protein n=1 Tax=Actinoplanes sandaracinus TaxID=3045177 RepID=A0ABT6WZD4_9ACTN|nr:hypothetical protein [Actinoplanes sandaracinus]MDI6105034.1 hypothetical protein [Actinoplanes sandaracinus]
MTELDRDRPRDPTAVLDRILHQGPLRLPMTLHHGETIALYRNLGIRMPGWYPAAATPSALGEAGPREAPQPRRPRFG